MGEKRSAFACMQKYLFPFFFPLEDMVLLPRMLKIYCPLSVMLEISLIKYIRSLLSLIDQSIHSMNYIGPL